VQRGEFGIDRGQVALGRGVEPGTGPHEVGMLQPGEPLLFGPEARLVTAGVDGGDPRAEPFVLDDPVGVRRQLRRDLPFDFLHCVVAAARGVGFVDGERAFERPRRPFVGKVRIGERRRLGVSPEPVEGGDLFRHSGRDGRREVGGHGVSKRGHAAARAGPRTGEAGQGGIGRGGLVHAAFSDRPASAACDRLARGGTQYRWWTDSPVNGTSATMSTGMSEPMGSCRGMVPRFPAPGTAALPLQWLFSSIGAESHRVRPPGGFCLNLASGTAQRLWMPITGSSSGDT